MWTLTPQSGQRPPSKGEWISLGAFAGIMLLTLGLLLFTEPREPPMTYVIQTLFVLAWVPLCVFAVLHSRS
jgi:hypothetical protein